MAEFAVVLVEPKYQGNIGMVARVMKNFGFSELVLVNPKTKIGKEARKMASHAQDILEKVKILKNFSELSEIYDFLISTSAIVATDRNYLRTPIFPENLKNSLKINGKIALIFGREDYGLLNNELKECDLLVTIPTSKIYPTLNIAISVAIILYEISKFKNEIELKKMRKFESANLIEKKILLEKFNALVDELYSNETQKLIVKKTFKTLIGRAFISGREAQSLIGVFRKAKEKIKL
ncbi:MAG: RNA methyltransferase [Candidatus Altiarchaeota archaeon]